MTVLYNHRHAFAVGIKGNLADPDRRFGFCLLLIQLFNLLQGFLRGIRTVIAVTADIDNLLDIRVQCRNALICAGA